MSRLVLFTRLAIAGVALLFTADVTFAQQAARALLRGTVTSSGDGAPVISAEVGTLDGHARSRTDERGRFRLDARLGDTVRVRALGYAERRVVVRGDEELPIVLTALPTTLPALTTTAGQREIQVGETPASVTVIDRATIDAAAAISANQILRQLPGLQETPSQPSATTISIRGLDASRVLVLVDGEPVGGGLIDDRDIGRLSTIAAERIEVTKGPSGVEFGSDALGGVINLVTAPPSRHWALDAVGRVGELGRRESTIDVSNTTGALGYRLSGGWRQTDEVTGIDADGSTLDRNYDIRSDLRYKMSDRLSLRFDAQYSRERQRWPVGGGYNGFIDDQGAQAMAEAQLQALGGTFRARAFGQLYTYEFRQAQGLLPIAGSADSLEQRERLGRFLLSYTRVAGVHTIDAGAQLSERWMVAPTKVAGDSANDRVIEFFARDGWTIDRVLVTAGARTTTSSLWGSALTPSVGAAWQLSSTVRLRANVARGFRAPSFKEIRYTFANPSAGYTVVGNPDLVPESSWSTSIGAAWAPVNGFSLEVEGYRNDVSNLIDTRLTGIDGAGLQVYQNVNVAKARTEGVEVNAHLIVGATTATVGYDYLDARDLETGLTLDRRSRHTARATLSRNWLTLAGFTTDLSARYTGAAPVGNLEQGAFLSIDGQLRLRLTRMWELSAGVNNLLDQRPALWTPAFQRQIYTGLRMRLGGE